MREGYECESFKSLDSNIWVVTEGLSSLMPTLSLFPMKCYSAVSPLVALHN